MKKIFQSGLSVVLALVMALGTISFAATAAETDNAETSAQTINVTTSQINSSGFRRAVQSALDKAANSATDSNTYTVNVAAGSYVNDNVSLKIYSNTTLDLRGVTVKRKSEGNIIRVGSEEYDDYSGKSGYYYKNIKILGGTLDGNMGYNTIVKGFHAKNFVLENVTVKNESEGHMMEVAGIDGFTLKGCTFKNQKLTPGHDGYEAVQLDVLHPYHVNGTRVEDLNMKNVLVEDCHFEDVPRGIGSHTAIHNNPHDGIIIRDCTFKNMTSIAIQGMGWINADIYRNTIENAPRGITVYDEADGCTYLSSLMAKKGKTTAHYSDAYKAPAKANIYIAYNTLKNIGYKNDIYASYESQGIAVLGTKLTKTSAKENDESGGLPAGDYYLDGIDIHDNHIEIKGNGIRLEDVRNAEVYRNTVICSKNTAHPANYYGIVLRSNAQVSEISYNTIVNPEKTGMQIDESKVTSINYNRINNTGAHGMGIYGSTIGSITDNDIDRTVDHGIWVSDGSKVTTKVRWNRIRNCGRSAIYFYDGSSGKSVGNNTAVSCRSNFGYDSDCSVQLESNNYYSAALTDFLLVKSGVNMRVGTSYKIVPDVRPVNTFATFSYSSSNSSVASVDSYGRIYANSLGKATVTVKSSNGKSKNYSVQVVSSGGVSYIEELTAPTPQITSLTSDENGITIKWNAVEGAAAYRVYYMSSDGWKRFASDVTGTTKLDTGVSYGRKETYTVRALNSNGDFISDYNHSGWSTTYGIDTPQITSLNSDENGITIKWSPVTGASTYRVYYMTSNGWKRFASDIKGTTKLDTGVSYGRTEQYTVRAVNKKGDVMSGYKSDGWKTTYGVAAPQITSLTSDENGINIKWSSVPGASTYRVYYMTSNGWKRFASDIKGTTKLDTGVSYGRAEQYTVRAVNKNGDVMSGYKSDGWKTTYKVATPQITSLVSTANGIQITWNSVPGVSSYRVYYKTSSGDWKRFNSDTKGLSRIDSGVVNGRAETYTVRALDKKGNPISDFKHSGWTTTYSYGSHSSSSETVYITETGAKYHTQNCRYCSGGCSPISLSEALAQGYTACSVCH